MDDWLTFTNVLKCIAVILGILFLFAFTRRRSSPPLMMLPPARRLRLDAAVPEEVIHSEPFDLAVAIRRGESPLLQIDELVRARSTEMQVEWPSDDSAVTLRIHVDAPFCSLKGTAYRLVRLNRGQDSPIVYYTLTPLRVGEIKITVTVYQLLVSLGSTRIPLTIREQIVGAVKTAVNSTRVTELEHHNDTRVLYRFIKRAFSLDEIQELCFQMGIEYYDLGGRSKTVKVANLISYCERRDRLEELIDHIIDARPDWMEIVGNV